MVLGFSIGDFGIFSPENLFLVAVALVWIVVAIVQDVRKREVANWWNFSLIAVALAYRAFLSVYLLNYWYVVFGVAGFGAGFVLANIFYYSRIFAGGDAKLLMGLGAVLPLSLNWFVNLKIFFYFCILFLLFGSIYSLIYSLILVSMNIKKFSKEFFKQLGLNRRLFYISFIFAVLFGILVLYLRHYLLLVLCILILLFPVLFIYAKSVEEVCMMGYVKPKDLTEGDWLVKDLKVAGKKIKADWEGLSQEDLKLIQKKYRRKVLIKQGIPFTPAFLLALAGLFLL